ncbi:chemotaxis protein CheC [Gammaproteobacteria bacterium]
MSTTDTWHLSVRFGFNVLRHGMDPLECLRCLATLGEMVGTTATWDTLPEPKAFNPEACYLGVEIDLRTTATKQEIIDAFQSMRDEIHIRLIPPKTEMEDWNSLTELQMDALTEVFNIGVGRAASSLSEIVGDEIKLSVPIIRLCPSSEINTNSLLITHQHMGIVRQHFNGLFDATAMLLFSEERALEMVRDMMKSEISIEDIAEFEQEAMCELGNIVLNACLSVMADMFNVVLSSSLPTYSVDSSDEIIYKIVCEESQPFVLLLHIYLEIEKHRSQGYLIFLLNYSSLNELTARIDKFISHIQ